MAPVELTFNVFYKGELLGTAKTDERFELVRSKLTEEQLDNLQAGDLHYQVISFT